MSGSLHTGKKKPPSFFLRDITNLMGEVNTQLAEDSEPEWELEESEEDEDSADNYFVEAECLEEEYFDKENLVEEEGTKTCNSYRRRNYEAQFIDIIQCEKLLAQDAHAWYSMNDRRNETVVRTGEGKDCERETAEKDATIMNGGDNSLRDRLNRNAKVRVRNGRGGHLKGRGRARLGGLRGESHGRVDDQQTQCMIDPPLEEILITDDDIPCELRNLEREIVRRRETRAQDMRDRDIRRSRKRRRVSEETTTERTDETTTETTTTDESDHEDEFEYSNDGRDTSLLDGESLRFDWSPMETFNPTEEIFTPQYTGSVVSHQTPYDAFRSFWDDSILEHIVDQTNRYAERITSDIFRQHWTPTNAHEIMCMLAFWIMLGIVRLPTLKSCFSTSSQLKTEVFSRLFTYRRYILLSWALHFAEVQSSNSGSADRLYLLRPVITHLNAKFQANFIPSKDILIDEGLTLLKKRQTIKQYIRSKASKFSIKTFELCDSATGYLWSFIVYTGKQYSPDLPHEPMVLKSTSIVKKLIEPLLNKGHTLFMDNWSNSPLLARFLKRNGTDCIGTLRPNRQDVPFIINKGPLKQGQLIARHSGDVCVLSWQDKERITMISTCHGSAFGLAQVPSKPGTRPLPFKPQVVLDYNRLGRVELKDLILEPYLFEQKKCGKWYKALFKRLVNVTILNARILLESSSQCRKDHLDFRLQLVDAIMTHHLPHVTVPRSLVRASTSQTPHSNSNTHWPALLEASSQQCKNRNPRLRCVQCARDKKESKTTIRCECCNVPLCVLGCFKKYHTT